MTAAQLIFKARDAALPAFGARVGSAGFGAPYIRH
jgi:hypothetical protein